MRNIQQLAAYVPYMVSIGNHEDSEGALAHFSHRFRHMPTTTGVVPVVTGNVANSWFYSWDAGLVHYVAISTGESKGCGGAHALLLSVPGRPLITGRALTPFRRDPLRVSQPGGAAVDVVKAGSRKSERQSRSGALDHRARSSRFLLQLRRQLHQ